MADADKGGKPWDGALGAVSKQLDEASKSVREAAAGPVNQARDAVLGEVDHAKELTSSARHAMREAAAQAWAAARTAVAPVVDVFQRTDGSEGTQLRKVLGEARVSLNAQLYATQMQLQETRKAADGQLVPVKGALVVAQQRRCAVFLKLVESFKVEGDKRTKCISGSERDALLQAGIAYFFAMTDSATRAFTSQWLNDHDQDRDNLRDDTVAQWLSVDRVAELMRQREEHHREDDFAVMDFETRAAALEAHFFHARQCDSPESDRKAPTHARAVTRVRPQSASVARRTAEDNAMNEIPVRQRPQSAKYRSETSCGGKSRKIIDPVDWSEPAQQKASKWREMLARGPEFKQFTLRRLELETYELLYSTLDQRQEVDSKPTSRRSRRRGKTVDTEKPNSYNKELACGSGLHLARSRKKRQQEHDRQMMLGKGRTSSRRSEQNTSKGGTEDTQVIKDETRRRGKLLKKKNSQQQESPIDYRSSNHEKQVSDSRVRRPSSAHQVTRGPWVPAGSSSSLAIRGIVPESNEAQVSQEKQVSQVLEAFQSHATTHLRLSKHAQNQLKKGQQSAKAAKTNDFRKTQQSCKHSLESKKSAKPARSISACNNDQVVGVKEQISRSNQENDRAEAIDLRIPLLTVGDSNEFQHPADGSEPLFSESPCILRVVIPPLKLPPNLWEYQQTGDSKSQVSQDSICEQVRDAPRDAAPFDEVRTDSIDVPAQLNTEDTAIPTEGLERPDKSSLTPKMVRQPTVEEGYLAESLIDQADSVVSSQDTEFPSDVLQGNLLSEQTAQENPGDDDHGMHQVPDLRKESSAGDSVSPTYVCGRFPESSEILILVEVSSSPVKDQLSDLASIQIAPSNASFAKESTLDVNLQIGQLGLLHVEELHEPECSTIETHVIEISASILENEPQPLACQRLGSDGDYAGSKPELCENVFDQSVKSVCETDEDPTAILLTPAQINEAESDTSTVPASSNSVVEDNTMSGISSSDCSQATTIQLAEKQNDLGTTENVDSSLPADSLEEPLPLETGSLVQLVADPVSVVEANDIALVTATEILEVPVLSSKVEDKKRGTNAVDEGQEVEHTNVEPSNSLPTEKPKTEKILAVAANSQLTALSVLPTDLNENSAVEAEPAPTKAATSAASREPTSSKKKASSAQPSLSRKSATRKHKKKSATSLTSTAINVEVSASIAVPDKASSPKLRGSIEPAEEDPLQLHQQELTRFFLQRVSSRKLAESEPTSTRTNSKDPVNQVAEYESAELAIAKAASVVMDIEPQLEQLVKLVKEREDIDGDSVSPLGREHAQALRDCTSSLETYPPTEDPSTTEVEDSTIALSTEKDDMAADFASVVDTSTSTPTVTGAETHPEELLLDSVVQSPKQEELQAPSDSDHKVLLPALIPPEPVESDAVPEFHEAACKIQAQYRCFVRRRLILDQLRFMVAKQRRQARRKSRQKPQKAKEIMVDTMTAVSGGNDASPVATDDANTMDGLQEAVQQVAPISVSSAIGFEMSPEASSSEVAEPSDEDVKPGARKDSCEYGLDLFDDSKEGDEEVVQEVSARRVEEGGEELSTMSVHCLSSEMTNTHETSMEKHDEPADKVTDEVVDSTDATTEFDSPQQVKDEESLLVSSSKTEFKFQNDEAPADGGLLSSMMLVELAFSDDAKADVPPVVEVSRDAEVQPHWERYVDSATNKSFYYNPTTNEQWTGPNDHPAINSSRATPTTPRVATITTDVAISPSEQSKPTPGTWQEFLDEASGQLFYYNAQTGETSWEPPAASIDCPEVVASIQSGPTAEGAAVGASPWVMYIDPASQLPYFMNVETMATSWEQPADFVVPAAAMQTKVDTTEGAGLSEDTYVFAVDDHAALEI
ncbi:unnamed protein product [Phytophthora lilii]|uniref:Unnamed protein product n=1 Tax=Phytophthora lilii TaxID=2077276 RepID=A0A9W6WQA7_9STRA|nr:unnamed protein product [Phytophthora lilii]